MALFDRLGEDAWSLGFVEVNVGVSTGDDEKVWDLVGDAGGVTGGVVNDCAGTG